MKQPGEHLECGGFTSAVRSQEPDDLSAPDAKAHLLDGVNVAKAAPEEAAHGGTEAALSSGT
jgi:hypothetical protein